MCSGGDNGDGENYVPYDSDSGRSFSDELILFHVVTALLIVIYEYWAT